MKSICLDIEGGEKTVFEPVEASLTIRGIVKLVAEVTGNDIAPFSDLAFKGIECDIEGADPEHGPYKQIPGGLDAALVADDDTGGRYLVVGDCCEDDQQDVLLSIHYQGPFQGGAMSLFVNVGDKKLADFWRRVQGDLLSRQARATDGEDKALNLVVGVLRFVSGSKVDLATLFDEWTRESGRRGGVQLVEQLKVAA